MSARATAVDRATAAEINPLISALWTEDTLDNLSGVIFELGYLAVADHNLATDHLFHLFGAIAGALAWERDHVESSKCKRGECEGGHYG